MSDDVSVNSVPWRRV